MLVLAIVWEESPGTEEQRSRGNATKGDLGKSATETYRSLPQGKGKVEIVG